MLNGTKDFALAPAELGGYEPYADDLRIELIADAGHFLHEERPQLIAETALRFFAQLRGESDARIAKSDRSATAPTSVC
jgi:pimeloyl-ACP methyl ester carboxylesterase